MCFFKNAALWGTKGSQRVRRNLRAIATLSRCGRPPRANRILTHGCQRRGYFRREASFDPADLVQGKRADSYLRFLDKDGGGWA